VEGLLDHLLPTPIGAYNVTVLLGFPLAAFAMYLLASAFTSNWTACFVAGLVFSFSTFHLARAMGHIGLATIEVAALLRLVPGLSSSGPQPAPPSWPASAPVSCPGRPSTTSRTS
jgi:uncharacterized membrane protein